MRDLIGRKLAPLASLAAQRRYILHATADHYYVPEEMLENAVEAARLGEKAWELPGPAKAQLADLGRLLRGPEPDVRSPDFIENDVVWGLLRDAARRTLDGMGFDLASWEAAELTPDNSA